MKLLLLLICCNYCFAQLPRIYPNYTDHPCKRKCDGKSKVCRYEFHILFMYTLEPNCLQCLQGNPADCGNPGCIVADGRKRLITAFNGMIPGPSIEVCLNDEVIVDVSNDLVETETTVHWHGMHQKNTQWNDGVPWITQCPILPGNIYRYHFKATEIGTHFYHSHSGVQLGDGAYGPIMVRQPIESDRHRKLYDYDLSEHFMLVSDWFYNTSRDNYFDIMRNKYFNFQMTSAVLTNGVAATIENKVAPRKFVVEKGKRYRFRVINSAGEVCALGITFEGHKITVISTDGNDIEPITVDTLYTLSGERYDFILEANQSPKNYPIKLFGGIVCDRLTSYSILQYKNGPDSKVDFADAEFADELGLAVNCINVFNNKRCYNYLNMTSLDPIEKKLKAAPTHQFYLSYDFYQYSRPELRGALQENSIEPFINNISFAQPASPLLYNPRDRNTKFCNADNLKDAKCDGSFCQCTHQIKVPKNSLVEIIFIDEGRLTLTHPMHIHGTNFRVIGQERLGGINSLEHVKQLDKEGKLIRNFNNPPVMDTVSVPYGGYTIVRFIADNPGTWAIHCHIDFHMLAGMFMVLQVGNTVNLPKNLPKCGNYLPTSRI